MTNEELVHIVRKQRSEIRELRERQDVLALALARLEEMFDPQCPSEAWRVTKEKPLIYLHQPDISDRIRGAA